MATHVLFPNEAEILIHSLTVDTLKEVGNKNWWSKHDTLEKLNMQALMNVSASTDEFVKDFIISYNKVPLLVYELIKSELWTDKLFVHIKNKLNAEKSMLSVYMTLFHEATVLSLLETSLFYKEFCEAAGDGVNDLIDYVHRKFTNLLLRNIEKETDAEKDDLTKQHSEIQFTIEMKVISVLRCVSDAVDSIPLSALTRLLQTHDFPCLLIQLLDASPWKRVSVDGKKQVFVENKWMGVSEGENHMISKIDGQVWLTLYQLLMHSEAQSKYEFNSYRRTQVLKLRRYMTDVLLEQLPILREMQRFLEMLNLMDPPPAKKDIIIEQVPEIRSRLESEYRGKWRKIAEEQASKYYTLTDEEMKEQARRLASTYNLDVLESFIQEPPVCAHCHGDATKRCSKCQNEWYCSRPCQVKHWSKHKVMCNIAS